MVLTTALDSALSWGEEQEKENEKLRHMARVADEAVDSAMMHGSGSYEHRMTLPRLTEALEALGEGEGSA